MIIKSLYNKTSLIDSVDPKKSGQYGIKIKTFFGKGENKRDIIIEGILKDAIGFQVDANWSTLGLDRAIDSIAASNGLLGVVDWFYDAGNLTTGSSFSNSGIFTKLFYKNSGRLGINPIFRIFDYDGSGICTIAATVLASLCIPSVKIGEDGKAAKLPLGPIVENGRTLISPLTKLAKKNAPFLNPVIDNMSEGMTEIGASDANWTDAPHPVQLQIGKWLTIERAVVENVSVTFSYECTDEGPMWCDVNLKLETRENLVIGTDGWLEQVRIGTTVMGSRVSITDESATIKGIFFKE